MTAPKLDYSAAQAKIRDDLAASHAQMLDYIRQPGAWFTGEQRNAIAAESRDADSCALCAERKNALSPEQAVGEHDSSGQLPVALVELIHRIRTDPGRLSRRVHEAITSTGISDAEYVEAVGIVAFVAGLDSQCRALGISPFALAEPIAGEPSRHIPANTTAGIAFVPLLQPEDATGPEANLYPGEGMVPNIMRALSLVPDHVRQLMASSNVHYVSLDDMTARRAIDRSQIELIAARVSALNQCFY